MPPVPHCIAVDCSCAAAEYKPTCFPHSRTQLQALKAGARPISTELAGIVFEDGDDDATTLQKAAAVDYATLGEQRTPVCTSFADASPCYR
jgi:hypothetical protein